jgi:hypothetical protein
MDAMITPTMNVFLLLFRIAASGAMLAVPTVFAQIPPPTDAPSTLRFAKFSPDASRVAFVPGNNLYVHDLRRMRITALTKDGSLTRIIVTTDLGADPDESNNLVLARPELARELKAPLEATKQSGRNRPWIRWTE